MIDKRGTKVNAGDRLIIPTPSGCIFALVEKVRKPLFFGSEKITFRIRGKDSQSMTQRQFRSSKWIKPILKSGK